MCIVCRKAGLNGSVEVHGTTAIDVVSTLFTKRNFVEGYEDKFCSVNDIS